MIIWDQRKLSWFYNHGLVLRLFVYGNSLQEVFLRGGVLKKCSKFSCKGTLTLMCNFVATLY